MGRVPSANIGLPRPYEYRTVGTRTVAYGAGRCPLLLTLEQGAGYKLNPKRVFLPGAYVAYVYEVQ